MGHHWNGSSGTTDVVHGTNFLVPPTGRAAAVVSVHDLTPLHHPELCDGATLAYPGLIRRALGRGAWVHTDSAFVAGEVVEAFGADPRRVRVVHPGIPDLPAPSVGAGAAALDRLLPPGTGRFCLAVGTAEPRKDLPGLVRAFSAVAARQEDVALVLAGPPGWGEQALTSAVAASAGPGQDRPHGLGRTGGSGRAARTRQPAGLPLPLRGIRVPAVAGDAGRRARRGDARRLVARGARRRRPLGRCRGPRRAGRGARGRPWATRPCAIASLPPARTGARATRGRTAAPASKCSIATRRTAVAERSSPTVLLAVEQLRRRVPGRHRRLHARPPQRAGRLLRRRVMRSS